MSPEIIYFAISNLVITGICLHQWEKNKKLEIELKLIKEGQIPSNKKKKENNENKDTTKYALPSPKNDDVIAQSYDDPDVIVLSPSEPKQITDNSLEKLKESLRNYANKKEA